MARLEICPICNETIIQGAHVCERVYVPGHHDEDPEEEKVFERVPDGKSMLDIDNFTGMGKGMK